MVSSLTFRVLMEPNDRSRRILAALVREYIASGEPVPRRVLAQRPGWACRRRRSAASWPGSRRRASSSSRTPRRGACRPTAATASTWTCCSSRNDRRAPPTAVEARLRRGDGAARGLGAVAGVSTWSRRRPGMSASRCGRPVKRPSSIASSSSRSAAARVLVVIVARGGHVLQKVIDIGEPLDVGRAPSGGELPERRVLGPAAPSGARAVLERMKRGTAAVRRADCPRDSARLVHLRRSAERAHPLRGRGGVAARRGSRADAEHAADAARR